MVGWGHWILFGIESSSRGLVSLYCLVACLSAAASSVAAGAKNDGVLGQEEREKGCGKL